jgi:hypothetical protein
MKVLLSRISLDIFNKRIEVSCSFFADAMTPPLDSNSIFFEFKPYSLDELQTLQYYKSLPSKAKENLCIFVSSSTEDSIPTADGGTSVVSYPRGVYRFTNSKWEKESDNIYFGNQFINKCLEKFEEYKQTYSLPDTELDYSDVTAFIGSIDYSKVFND